MLDLAPQEPPPVAELRSEGSAEAGAVKLADLGKPIKRRELLLKPLALLLMVPQRPLDGGELGALGDCLDEVPDLGLDPPQLLLEPRPLGRLLREVGLEPGGGVLDRRGHHVGAQQRALDRVQHFTVRRLHGHRGRVGADGAAALHVGEALVDEVGAPPAAAA